MKYLSWCFLLAYLPVNLSGQVIDSTFGIPDSFIGIPGTYIPGCTGSDFEGRADQSFTSLHLDDGKIIMAGYTRGMDGNDFAMVRLLPDGQFDESAGPEGEIRLDLGYFNDSCLAATRYEADRILMGGCVSLAGQVNYSNLIIRTDFDGNLDPTFGDNGKTIIDLPSEYEMITKILVQPDNKIIIAGNVFYNTFIFPDSTAIFVGRLLPDGRVDSTFGLNGFLYRRYEQDCKSSLLADAVLDEKNCIIVSGGSYSPYPGFYNIDKSCSHNIHVLRFLQNGQPDPGFGVNGIVELPFTEGRATALYQEKDGRLLVAGVISNFEVQPVYTLLTRLLPNGDPDSTFGTNGRFVKFILGGSTGSEPFGIVRIRNKIIMGYVDDPEGNHITFGLICISEGGSFDVNFGNGGTFSFLQIYPWNLYQINNITTADSQSVFLGGYYSTLTPNNMIVCKIKLNNLMISTASAIQKKTVIYPNPSRGDNFYLDMPSSDASYKTALTIRDLNGRTVVFKKNLGHLEQIDIRDLANGIYFIEARSAGTIFFDRLVVQR